MLLGGHKAHIKQMAQTLERESELLEQVDRPGSDVEQYVTALNAILDEKVQSILRLKETLNGFADKLAQEKKLSEKIQEMERADEDENYAD